MLPSMVALLLVAVPSPVLRELSFRDRQAIESSRSNYYELRRDEVGEYLHADYRAGDEAVKQALVLPETDRGGHFDLSWRWRALKLPVGGNDCIPDRTDSAASVYVAWRRGLRWYGLKYSWSSVGPLGATCDGRDNPFLRGETVIVETGGPLNVWRNERIDLNAEFRKHFAGGNSAADVPDLIGIAVLTDGDQTRSDSSGDFGSLVLIAHPAPRAAP